MTAAVFVRACEGCEEPADEVRGGEVFDCLYCQCILCRDCHYDHHVFGCDCDCPSGGVGMIEEDIDD